jgi:GH35 family endo-1,4-beta-xylanase
MAGVDAILNYAQANNQRVRMHNLIWGSQQPSWVTTLLSQAASGNATAKADLRAEISERIGYYVGTGAPGDRANKYVDLDLYNESYHTGSTVSGSYWNVYTPAGIADMYREAKAVAPNLRIYANEYNVYADGSDRYANWYQQHIESLRNAGFTAGYGDIVSGIGTQYYANTTIETGDPNAGTASNGAHNAAHMMQTLQNLSTEGLPITLTEFGVKSGASQTTAAQILSDALRITFGNANANGFMMWGFQAENGGGNLFAPAAALFNVSTSNWNAWTITEAGKAWQDLLGIQDWDGDPNDGWTTHVMPTVNPDGTINFTGFYGDYNIANQGGFSNLALVKGTSGYTLSLAAPPGWHFWNGAASGNWGDAPSWSNGAPDGVGQTAHFGSAASPVNVNVAAPVTVGMINFDSANAYTIGGDATISMSGPAGVVAMNVVNGSHTISAPLAINDDLNVLVRPAASTLTLTNLQPSSSLITKTGAGALAVNAIRAAGLTINDGTVAVLASGAPSAVSRVATLSVSPTAALDLNDNDIVVTNGSISQVSNLIAQARHGGAWDRQGITSSAAKAQASHATTLGVLSGAEYLSANGASFDGFDVAPDDVLVKYTWYGDSDFNGQVNFDDYVRIDNGFNNGLSGWLNGDFDGNGAVNFDDYVLIDLAFNTQDGTLGRALRFLDGSDRSDSGMNGNALQRVATDFDRFGIDYAQHLLSAVPEPLSPTLAGMVTLVTMMNRRRKTKEL